MKKQTVIIIVAIAALGLLYYFFIYKKNQTEAAVTIANPGTPVIDPTQQVAVVNAPPSFLAAATAASQKATMAPDVISTAPIPVVAPGVLIPITPAVYDSAILPWMNSLGVNNKSQALKIYPSMTDAEKHSLADIILNVWGGRRPLTAADSQFWNAWRVKYHVNDGTYSPFAGDAQTAYLGLNDFDSAQDPYSPHSIDPLAPVMNSQQANNFVIKGSSQSAYNGFKGKGKGKKNNFGTKIPT